MYYKTLRPASAMIELIFALVVMGITLMSAPMLISMSTQSSFVAIQQEAINEAAARANMVTGYHWDEQDTNELYLPPILHVNPVNADLGEVGTTGYRSGTPFESKRSFIREDGNRILQASAAGTFGAADAGDVGEDDIDDFSGDDSTLTDIGDGDAGNVETVTININTAVAYATDTVGAGGYNQAAIVYNPFTGAGGTTNIKSVTITLTSIDNAGEVAIDELDKEVVLRAFSSNIGGYKLEEKDF